MTQITTMKSTLEVEEGGTKILDLFACMAQIKVL